MLTRFVTACVAFSRRFAALVVLMALVLSLALGWFVAGHIRINTDVNQLLADDLPWRQQEKALEQAFPQTSDRLVIVIDANSADAAEQAAASLAEKMAAEPALFKNVKRPEAIPFFRTHGLLFLSEEKLGTVLDQLVQAQPMLGSLAADPSLRGLFGTLELMLMGLAQGQITYDRLDQPLAAIADSIEAALKGSTKPLPWQSLMGGESSPDPTALRKFILTQPVLDYGNLAPGQQARDRVRQLTEALNLTSTNGVTVRMTGSVALNDEEFSSVAQGTTEATIFSMAGVILLLVLALRSGRVIGPVVITLLVGLVATTAFAVAAVGSLNLISVAFAVMFIGIAVDFGIQFGVRYRDQRHTHPDPEIAMLATAKVIALPLSLAAATTTLGFLTFIPTDYRGVAELGLIAGVGMIIAFVLNIMLLPALLTLFKPPPEPESVGYRWLAPLDIFLRQRRTTVLVVSGLLALGGLVAISQLRFDFDPLNLKDPNTESVRTLLDLMRDPNANPYTIQILAPSLKAAAATADAVGKLPEVGQVLSLHSFVPENQALKASLIADANFVLAPTLQPTDVKPAPTTEEALQSIQSLVTALDTSARDQPTAQRLRAALQQVVAEDNPKLLARLHAALVAGVVAQMETIRTLLSAQPVTLDSISDDLRQDWVTADGRARVEIYPKEDVRDHRAMERFTAAVRAVAPESTGAPISIQESGKTVTSAFVAAGLYALLAISLLLWLTLRNWGDVLRLLSALFLAGILTLATMALLNVPLNFANIIALPLLLSLGVSYAIYFITSWRAGENMPLQSSMARAVLFSAATTMLAFSSLLISAHAGTRSMGQLLTIALLYCVLCSYVFLVALLGKPKQV